MLTRLSKVADLRVTSRTSVMMFRDSREPLPEIARQLGVTWVLQGEVEEIGERVRVNARLVNAPQDRQVWAESYVRELTVEDLFAIQGELTREIVDQLQAQLSPAQARAVGGAPTTDLDAYRLRFARSWSSGPRRSYGRQRPTFGRRSSAIQTTHWPGPVSPTHCHCRGSTTTHRSPSCCQRPRSPRNALSSSTPTSPKHTPRSGSCVLSAGKDRTRSSG